MLNEVRSVGLEEGEVLREEVAERGGLTMLVNEDRVEGVVIGMT